MKYRTVWVSDVHLGTRSCKADMFHAFLKQVDAEKLYLVGDIVDGWVMKKRWFWPRKHNSIIRKLLGLAKKTEVIFIPGNHDEFARSYCPMQLGDIKVLTHDVHQTAKGESMIILHGDIFDGFVTKSKWLSQVGSILYDMIIQMNDFYHTICKFLGKDYWSLSTYIKSRTKEAIKVVDRFEGAAVNYAKLKGFDAILCGHIHQPALKVLDDIIYLNTGDWVENCSYITEDYNGNLEAHLFRHPRKEEEF